MKASSVNSFTKTIACPSSNILLAFHFQALTPEIMTLVSHHLAACDFCYAEMPLLAYYTKPLRGECKAPEMPINLRILAESLMWKSDPARREIALNQSEKFGLLKTQG